MGICLALCLKNAEPGVGKLGVGSCLCGLAAVIAFFVVTPVWITKNFAEKYGVSLSVRDWIEDSFVAFWGMVRNFNGKDLHMLLILAACEAIPCFLIAWLTGRILRKKSNK